MAAGEDARPGRGAGGGGGVEMVEPQSRGGGGVEVRCFEMGMAVVSDISPALIVRHHEDDVGTSRLRALAIVFPFARLDRPRRESGDERERKDEDIGKAGPHEKRANGRVRDPETIRKRKAFP